MLFGQARTFGKNKRVLVLKRRSILKTTRLKGSKNPDYRRVDAQASPAGTDWIERVFEKLPGMQAAVLKALLATVPSLTSEGNGNAFF